MMGEDGKLEESILAQLFPVLFFISYYIIISIVLFNIIVAILLDEFMVANEAAKQKKRTSQVHAFAC